VLITLPVHPFVGVALPVVRFTRDRMSGRRYVVAEHPRKGQLVLPLDWTDRAPSRPVPVSRGHEVRADVAGLLAVARALATCREVDKRDDASARCAEPEHACRKPKASPRAHRQDGVVLVPGDGTAERGRGVGDADPQDDTPARGVR